MSQYAVIAQNDESRWNDDKGELYHYPTTYRSILTPGCKIVYYKGKLTNPVFRAHRLSPEPHYFGCGLIGDSIPDPDSKRSALYSEILDYQEFKSAVPIKMEGSYLEDIPPSRATNYWRYGVREVSRTVYETILRHATITGYRPQLPNEDRDFESYNLVEGNKKVRFSSYYERNPFYRQKAIDIHGVTCMVCNMQFQDRYGELGRQYIHVHHNMPVSESGPTRINPPTDLSVLCANCHAMIHRAKARTLTVAELKSLYELHNPKSD